jgi:DNA-binding Lrp family transcriptional regulator
MLDELDKKIIVIMQAEFPLVAEPYLEIAEKLGISEDELLKRLKGYRQSGKIRKMGAVLRHREVGYAANALCAWIVPDERIEEIGKMLAKDTIISHLYARVSQAGWPYNFYTMIHAHTRKDCKVIAQDIAERTGLQEYVMLFSTKEWKKISMQYFKDSNN